jgi:Bacterial membrane protein YfhO
MPTPHRSLKLRGFLLHKQLPDQAILRSKNVKSSTKVLASFTGLLMLLLVAYYGQFLINRASFFIYDLYAGWQPFLTYMGERLRHGQLPLWNPYVLSGISQVDIMAPSAFYPVYLLFAALPFNPAYATMMVLQQTIAGCGMFLLIRSFGWGAWAAALGGVTFALCGTMFSLQPTPTMMGTIAWFIVAWWGQRCIDTTLPSGKLLRTVADILFVYLMITAGVVEAFAPGLVFLGLAAVSEYFSVAKNNRRRALWVLGLRLLALFTGTLMSACAVIPAAEWARLSPRAQGLTLSEIFAWSCNWYEMLCTVVLQPLGDLYVPTNPYRDFVATSLNRTPYLANAFIGPIIITLAIWGACDRRFKYRWLAISVFILSVIVALGSSIPALVLLVKTLKLQAFRYPVKAMIFATLSATVLAARGMHTLVSERPSAGYVVSAVVWLICTLSGASLWLVGSHPGWVPQLHIVGVWGEIIVKCGTALFTASLLGLLCTGLWHRQSLFSAKTAAGIILSGTIALFMSDAWMFNRHPGPADFYDEPSIVANVLRMRYKPQGNLLRAAVNYHNPHGPAVIIDPQSPMISIYRYTRNLMSPSTNISMKIGDVVDYIVGQSADNKSLWKTARDLYFADKGSLPLGVMCQMTGAQAICAELGLINDKGTVGTRFPRFDRQYFKNILERPDLNLGMYEVREPLPRVYFAPSVKWGKPHSAVLTYISRPDKSGFDPHNRVVLEHLDSDGIGPRTEASPSASRLSLAEITVDHPEYLRVEATTPVDNFLVVADQYYPGWHAKVDGKRATIYPANVILRAVFVPKGHHVVEFTYAPASLRWGLLLHILGWLVIIKLIVLAFIVRRTQTAST